MADSYSIAKDSPVTRATVDKQALKLGDDPVSLKVDQVKRLEDIGVKLEKSSSSNS